MIHTRIPDRRIISAGPADAGNTARLARFAIATIQFVTEVSRDLRRWRITVDHWDPHYAAAGGAPARRCRMIPRCQLELAPAADLQGSRPCCSVLLGYAPRTPPDGCDLRLLASRPQLRGGKMRLAYPNAKTNSSCCSSERRPDTFAAGPLLRVHNRRGKPASDDRRRSLRVASSG